MGKFLKHYKLIGAEKADWEYVSRNIKNRRVIKKDPMENWRQLLIKATYYSNDINLSNIKIIKWKLRNRKL